MNVMQILSISGGLSVFANADDILILEKIRLIMMLLNLNTMK